MKRLFFGYCSFLMKIWISDKLREKISIRWDKKLEKSEGESLNISRFLKFVKQSKEYFQLNYVNILFSIVKITYVVGRDHFFSSSFHFFFAHICFWLGKHTLGSTHGGSIFTGQGCYCHKTFLFLRKNIIINM